MTMTTRTPVTVPVLLTILIFCCLAAARDHQKSMIASFKPHEFRFQGIDRHYWLYQPAARKLQSSIPVVFVLHGGGGFAKNMPNFINRGFQKLADRDGFLVVYPQGVGNQWNDGRDPTSYPVLNKHAAWSKNVDDVGFLVEILNRLETVYPIDRDKVFACGNSNGGFMSNRLICDRPDVFKGAGIITATMDASYVNRCRPTLPVAVIIMNGTLDTAIPYDGGPLMISSGTQKGYSISTEEYTLFWAKHNGCSGVSPVTYLPDKEPDDGTTVSFVQHTGCKPGGNVTLYTIHGGGHTWPGGSDSTPVLKLMETVVGKTSHEINACEIMWHFFMSL